VRRRAAVRRAVPSQLLGRIDPTLVAATRPRPLLHALLRALLDAHAAARTERGALGLVRQASWPARAQ